MESKLRSVLVASAFALAGGIFFPAHGAPITALSGYEVLPSIDSPITSGNVYFAGWTPRGNGSKWRPFESGSGGFWYVVASTSGTSGITGTQHSATVTGTFNLDWVDRSSLQGSIAGSVTWPATLEMDIGCGSGIATVDLTIVTSAAQSGMINGCLDDTHLHAVFPPKVWGTLTR